MIEVHIKFAGALIDRPRIAKILIEDESSVAIRRKDEETNKVEQFTIAVLFDTFQKKASYNSFGPDSRLFEDWFSEKYIKNTGIESSIIGIEYIRK
jgi:hypothetical protein